MLGPSYLNGRFVSAGLTRSVKFDRVPANQLWHFGCEVGKRSTRIAITEAIKFSLWEGMFLVSLPAYSCKPVWGQATQVNVLMSCVSIDDKRGKWLCLIPK